MNGNTWKASPTPNVTTLNGVRGRVWVLESPRGVKSFALVAVVLIPRNKGDEFNRVLVPAEVTLDPQIALDAEALL